ncbi:MAG: hypothetical protein WD342_07815 [Verrucomicrobiales bacterium]
MKLIFLILLFLFPLYAYGFIGGSPDEFLKAFGPPEHESVKDGAKLKGYQPQTPALKGVIVLASFQGDKAQRVNFQTVSEIDFSLGQIKEIKALNEKHLKKDFIEIGFTPDKKRHIWATEDNSIYFTHTPELAEISIFGMSFAMDWLKENGLPISGSGDSAKDLSVEDCNRRFGRPLKEPELTSSGWRSLYAPNGWKGNGMVLALYTLHHPKTKDFRNMTISFHSIEDATKKQWAPKQIPFSLFNDALEFLTGFGFKSLEDFESKEKHQAEGDSYFVRLSDDFLFLIGKDENGDSKYGLAVPPAKW